MLVRLPDNRPSANGRNPAFCACLNDRQLLKDRFEPLNVGNVGGNRPYGSFRQSPISTASTSRPTIRLLKGRLRPTSARFANHRAHGVGRLQLPFDHSSRRQGQQPQFVTGLHSVDEAQRLAAAVRNDLPLIVDCYRMDRRRAVDALPRLRLRSLAHAAPLSPAVYRDLVTALFTMRLPILGFGILYVFVSTLGRELIKLVDCD